MTTAIMTNSEERLQKVLAQAGLGSRRTMESWIKAGRVSINGRIARLGDRVSRGDRIQVDGRWVPEDRLFPCSFQVLAYYKPSGIVCTRVDPKGRPTVYAQLPKPSCGRWISIGRLDLMTSGLLLFTNSGRFAHQMMHPSTQIEREYAVRVLGKVNRGMLERLQQGVKLDDGMARFESIVDAGGQGANHWFYVVLREGRNREVHRLWESQNLKVSRLIRIRYGPVVLPRDKRSGQWWRPQSLELEKLFEQTGMIPMQDGLQLPQCSLT